METNENNKRNLRPEVTRATALNKMQTFARRIEISTASLPAGRIGRRRRRTLRGIRRAAFAMRKQDAPKASFTSQSHELNEHVCSKGNVHTRVRKLRFGRRERDLTRCSAKSDVSPPGCDTSRLRPAYQLHFSAYAVPSVL